jgi:hypothetical protein
MLCRYLHATDVTDIVETGETADLMGLLDQTAHIASWVAGTGALKRNHITTEYLMDLSRLEVRARRRAGSGVGEMSGGEARVARVP